MASSTGQLVVKPLTSRLWPAFADLFDQGGPAGRCWCMAPRIGADWRRRPPEANRDDLCALVAEGPAPGLLAFQGAVAVGWCQITPRERVPAIERSWRTRRVDDVPVWVVSCFYVRKGHRRQGVTAALIDGAVSPSATSTGYVSTFAAAGFVEVARRSPEKPIMRYTFTE